MYRLFRDLSNNLLLQYLIKLYTTLLFLEDLQLDMEQERITEVLI